jgi:hypothetical protein
MDSMKLMGTGIVGGWLLAGMVLAQPAPEVSRVHGDQQVIQARTGDVIGQIDRLLAALEANALEGEDTRIYAELRGKLDGLSRQEMTAVLSALSEVLRGSSDAAHRREKLGVVQKNQKEIVAKLGRLLTELERRRAMAELQAKADDLLKRQTDAVVRSAVEERTSRDKAAAQAERKAEQERLAEDVGELLDALKKTAAKAEGLDKQTLAEANKTAERTKLAEKATRAAEIPSIESMKEAREALRDLSRTLAPEQALPAALEEAVRQVDKLAQEQAAVRDETRASRATPEKAEPLREQQMALEEQSKLAREDFAAVSPEAAQALETAAASMKKSADKLERQGKQLSQESLRHQQEALSALDKAKGELQKMAAKAETPSLQEALQAAGELREKLQEAMKEQGQNLAQTEAAAAQAQAGQPVPSDALKAMAQSQAGLKENVASLASEALPTSVPAAEALNGAAQNMAQAQQAMKNASSLPQAQVAQQQAMAQMAAAIEMLDSRIAAMEAMQGQMEQLAQASWMLDQLAAQMEQLSGQLAEGGPTMQQASQPLASAAQQAAQMSSQLSESLPAAAEQALTEASQAMAAAAQSAAQSQQAPAEAQAAAAQAALAQAQQAVAAAMAAAPGAAPGPPGAAPGPPGQAPGEGSTPAGADAPATADIANATLTTGELYGSGPDFLERLKAGDTAGRKREGAAVSEQEKRPQAYREMVDQYYRNLAEEAARSR